MSSFINLQTVLQFVLLFHEDEALREPKKPPNC